MIVQEFSAWRRLDFRIFCLLGGCNFCAWTWKIKNCRMFSFLSHATYYYYLFQGRICQCRRKRCYHLSYPHWAEKVKLSLTKIYYKMKPNNINLVCAHRARNSILSNIWPKKESRESKLISWLKSNLMGHSGAAKSRPFCLRSKEWWVTPCNLATFNSQYLVIHWLIVGIHLKKFVVHQTFISHTSSSSCGATFELLLVATLLNN